MGRNSPAECRSGLASLAQFPLYICTRLHTSLSLFCYHSVAVGIYSLTQLCRVRVPMRVSCVCVVVSSGRQSPASLDDLYGNNQGGNLLSLSVCLRVSEKERRRMMMMRRKEEEGELCACV